MADGSSVRTRASKSGSVAATWVARATIRSVVTGVSTVAPVVASGTSQGTPEPKVDGEAVPLGAGGSASREAARSSSEAKSTTGVPPCASWNMANCGAFDAGSIWNRPRRAERTARSSVAVASCRPSFPIWGKRERV